MVFSTLALAVMVAAGCRGAKTQPIQEAQHRHILQMASIYRAYLAAHDQKPPSSTQALKEWALKQGKEKLQIADSVEDALKSPRDGEPYGFIPPPRQKRGPQPVLVYEKTGVKGNHIIAGEMGNVGDWTDKELEQVIQNPR
jgi:hypothetical protein